MCDNHHNNNTGTNGLTENRYNVIVKMLYSIAKREGIENPKFEISKGSEKGDGFVGEKNRVILQGSNKSMDLFVKGAPTSEAFQKLFDTRPLYLLEIMFYKDVYPTFNKFQTEKNIPKPFTSVIEYVDICSEEGNQILIMQNARSLGYELSDKMKRMNKEHVEFVYTEYGKYHGISFAMKDQQRKAYQELVNRIPAVALEIFSEKMAEPLIEMAKQGKPLFDPETETDKYNRYLDYLDNMLEKIKGLAQQNHPYTVIVHGDCWSNNMMFKYSSKSDKVHPESMCLLDFQLIGQASPVMDLAYFLYASAPKEIYDNLDHYLHVYYDSLSKTIRDLGSDPEVLMPFEELKHHWKLYSVYGLMMSSMVLKICTQERDEIMEFTEVMDATNGEDMMAGLTKKGKHDKLYNQRLKDLIEHMMDNDYI